MKIVGIIVEYNPLHNGHIHHINEVKAKSGADIIIACMSSTMTMRGDISLYDKFTKAKQALEANVDLVVELPCLYSMQRADIFAYNSVKILSLLKVNEIWIGSEANDPKLYEEAYYKLNSNDDKINELMNKGLSYKEATSSIIDLPSNDLLGYSYFKAIKENNLDIELKTIKRIKSDYLDKTPTDSSITSAMAIRGDINLLDKYTPVFVSSNKTIRNEEMIFSFLKYKILSESLEDLKSTFFVDEGLENRLKSIKDYDNLNDYVNYLTTKRYTSSRIKRMLYYVLFDIKKSEVNNITSPDFIRVLGYNDVGKLYISNIKKEVTIYTNIKEGINQILDTELKITKIIDSIYNTSIFSLEQKGPVKK